MFRAVLSNPQRPEYGQITIPFPLREDAYHPMDILPWEYPLLLHRTLARLRQNTGGTRL